MFPVFLEAPHCYLNNIPMFFKPLSLWSWIFLSRNFFDHRSRLLLVVSVVLSRLGSSLLFSSLVWYAFLLLPLFTFSCSGFRGSLVVDAFLVPPFFFFFFYLWSCDHCLSPLPHFFGWNFVEPILAMGSYSSNFMVIM